MVFSEIPSVRPISLFERPSRSSRSTSICRPVKLTLLFRAPSSPASSRVDGWVVGQESRHINIASENELHRSEDGSRRRGFRDIAKSAGGQGAAHIARVLGRRHNDDRKLRLAPAKFLKRRESVALGHRQIENDKVEIGMPIGKAKTLRAALGQKHRDLRAQLTEQGGEAVPDNRMVIDNQKLHGPIVTRISWPHKIDLKPKPSPRTSGQ